MSSISSAFFSDVYNSWYLFTTTRRNDSLLSSGKEDDCVCVCWKSPNAKLFALKWAVFSLLSSRSFKVSSVFPTELTQFSLRLYRRSCNVQIRMPDMSDLFEHWQGGAKQTRGFTLPNQCGPVRFFCRVTNCTLASKQMCFQQDTTVLSHATQFLYLFLRPVGLNKEIEIVLRVTGLLCFTVICTPTGTNRATVTVMWSDAPLCRYGRHVKGYHDENLDVI
jgi:hypothetical protein